MTVDRLRQAEKIIYASLPALGAHARGFSQEALALACHFVGADPEDWTSYPDVLARRRTILIAQGELPGTPAERRAARAEIKSWSTA